MAPTAAVLNLNTLTDRSQIKIDGKSYELKSRDEFALLAYRTLATKFQRLGTLLPAKTLSRTKDRERTRLLDELCRGILEAPPAVHARLRDVHRMQILTVFSQLLRPTTTPAGATPPARRRTKASGASARA